MKRVEQGVASAGPHRALTRAGAVAAAAVGAAALAAGWRWLALLILWFALAQLLTALGAGAKLARTASVLTPERGRGARQVIANGGVFAVAAALGALTGDARWSIAALGALAAAAADTWATEIGLLAGGTPRALLGGAPVEPGTSGGVTWAGTAGAFAGAVTIAAVGVGALGLPATVPTADPPATTALSAILAIAAITAAGVLGAFADSILGGTLQARRRCVECGAWTERRRHSCGGATQHARGLPVLDNDLVNLLATMVGALVAYGLA